MHWILQENIFNESAYTTLIETLERFDIPHSIHKVVPFVGELIPDPSTLIPCEEKCFVSRMCERGTKGCITRHDNVICFGSYSMRHTAAREGWYPGVFDIEDQDFTVQMQHWGQYMFNADAVVCRFEDAVFTEDLMFIRPTKDSKVFAGTLMEKADFEEWQHKVCVLEEDYGDSLTKDTMIQVCRPKKIHAEYRFWIVKGQKVTWSLYKRGDRVIYSPMVDDHIHRFVDMILKTKDNSTSITLSMANDGWMPDEAFCIDIFDTSDGPFVGEIGTINSCGFYAANITDLVLSLEHGFNGK